MDQGEAVAINVSNVLDVMTPELRDAHLLLNALIPSPQAGALRGLYSTHFADITRRLANCHPSEKDEILYLQRTMREIMIKMDFFAIAANDIILAYKDEAMQAAIKAKADGEQEAVEYSNDRDNI